MFDDFVRAADTEWARRIYDAEGRAAALARQARDAELRAAIAEDRAEAAMLRLGQSGTEAARLRMAAESSASLAARLEHEAAAATAEWHHAVRVASAAEQARAEAAGWLDAVRRSTSWRLTKPIRWAARQMRGASPPPAVPTVPAPPPAVPSVPAPAIEPVAAAAAPPAVGRADPPSRAPGWAPSRAPCRAVHQFHSGTAVGDAITNAMLLTQRVLRGLGYDSRIFAEHPDPALADRIHHIDDLPRHDRYVLIVRHSMGHDALDRVLALPARKVLLYHNITPPELLEGAPFLQRYARLGREQLPLLRGAVDAALADSAFNAIELLRLGFDPVAACTCCSTSMPCWPPQRQMSRAAPQHRMSRAPPQRHRVTAAVSRSCSSGG